MSITKIRELIEKENGEKAIEPILTLEENSTGDSWLFYPAASQFYSDISIEHERLNKPE
ncbi:MAG: hypothetical protein HRT56_03500 [Coraliomargarita sp.]|nr:hypothetical protein [Coraliomargarita sp.]